MSTFTPVNPEYRSATTTTRQSQLFVARDQPPDQPEADSDVAELGDDFLEITREYRFEKRRPAKSQRTSAPPRSNGIDKHSSQSSRKQKRTETLYAKLTSAPVFDYINPTVINGVLSMQSTEPSLSEIRLNNSDPDAGAGHVGSVCKTEMSLQNGVDDDNGILTPPSETEDQYTFLKVREIGPLPIVEMDVSYIDLDDIPSLHEAWSVASNDTEMSFVDLDDFPHSPPIEPPHQPQTVIAHPRKPLLNLKLRKVELGRELAIPRRITPDLLSPSVPAKLMLAKDISPIQLDEDIDLFSLTNDQVTQQFAKPEPGTKPSSHTTLTKCTTDTVGDGPQDCRDNRTQAQKKADTPSAFTRAAVLGAAERLARLGKHRDSRERKVSFNDRKARATLAQWRN